MAKKLRKKKTSYKIAKFALTKKVYQSLQFPSQKSGVTQK